MDGAQSYSPSATGKDPLLPKFLLGAMLLAGVCALSACGGGATSDNSAAESPAAALNGASPDGHNATTTRLDNIIICGTSVANSSTSCPDSPPVMDTDNRGFWNSVEIYYTSAATRAVIFLHGGGGTNYGLANNLGLLSNAAPPADVSDVDFSWLSANNIIAVFPQGQALNDAPGGGTWNNWVMDSGQDDETMLQALAAYVKGKYGVSSVYLVGHSNGGMMANRMWCESPTTFDGYVALSGPASQHYLTRGNACAPARAAAKPYYGIIGGQDTVLCDNGGATDYGAADPLSGCDPAASWTSATWSINQTYIQSFAAMEFVNPLLISEPQQQLARASLMCGEKALTPDAALSNGANTAWSNCGGQLVLQEVPGANHPVSYSNGLCSISSGNNCSLEVASRSGMAGSTGLLDLIVGFLNDQESR
jgi:polyhydroxybutyrate depolymerase